MNDERQKELGRRGEDLAAIHLRRLGYRILARNHRTRFGELDIVAAADGVIVFVEVKARRAGTGAPFDNLHESKRKQVRRMAAAWLAEASGRPYAEELRFDAVGVLLSATGELVSLDHLEGVF